MPSSTTPQNLVCHHPRLACHEYRGQHDDLSRGPFPTLAFQKHQLEVFAAHKINLYSPYFENNLEYSADPLAAPPGGALTRDEARELVAFATPLHIMIVPEQEAFGHVHHVLQYEKYANVAETPHGNVIAPGQPASLPLIVSWFTQIAADFPSPFLHIGADETFDLGLGRTQPDVARRGLGPVYADFLSNIHTALAPLNRRLIFWGDIGDSDPSAIPGIPKDMIAVPWIYWHKDSYDNDILPFKKQGLETWVAPGDANWRQVFPVEKTALDNISGFVAAGQRLGSTGVLQTVWNDDGEGLYNQDWFGTLFGAAAGWQSGKAEAAPYEASFGKIFYGDTSGRVNQAQAEIMAAEDLIDVSDETFWLDPWSPAGIAKADKLRPNLSAARLHAEHAIELIESALATDPSLREKDSPRHATKSARRIDFIALKFQLSDEMRDAYAQAYDLQHDRKKDSTTTNLLYNISSMNGRCQDLRDGFSLLKNLYRESWLAENRPYWLDNVLVRYDMQTQLWQKRGDTIDAVIETSTPPAPFRPHPSWEFPHQQQSPNAHMRPTQISSPPPPYSRCRRFWTRAQPSRSRPASGRISSFPTRSSPPCCKPGSMPSMPTTQPPIAPSSQNIFPTACPTSTTISPSATSPAASNFFALRSRHPIKSPAGSRTAAGIASPASC